MITFFGIRRRPLFLGLSLAAALAAGGAAEAERDFHSLSFLGVGAGRYWARGDNQLFSSKTGKLFAPGATFAAEPLLFAANDTHAVVVAGGKLQRLALASPANPEVVLADAGNVDTVLWLPDVKRFAAYAGSGDGRVWVGDATGGDWKTAKLPGDSTDVSVIRLAAAGSNWVLLGAKSGQTAAGEPTEQPLCWHSPDGLAWSAVTPAGLKPADRFAGVAFAQGIWVLAAGEDIALPDGTPRFALRLWHSPNGRAWTAVAPTGATARFAPSGPVVGPAGFVVGLGAQVYVSADGKTFAARAAPKSTRFRLWPVDGRGYWATDHGSSVWSSTDAVTWKTHELLGWEVAELYAPLGGTTPHPVVWVRDRDRVPAAGPLEEFLPR